MVTTALRAGTDVRLLMAAGAVALVVYTAFFAAMALVRFVGDAVRARLGAVRTIRLAGGTATAGYGRSPSSRCPGSTT